MRSGHPDAAIPDNVALTSFGAPRPAGRGQRFGGFTLLLLPSDPATRTPPTDDVLVLVHFQHTFCPSSTDRTGTARRHVPAHHLNLSQTTRASSLTLSCGLRPHFNNLWHLSPILPHEP
ncbi:hypothetical protein C8Q74DRAFT_613369 [Fomes fomentarius]|nr:hypothetical protein C8Q74DRAFT_613369 [Fomes fomentarius]